MPDRGWILAQLVVAGVLLALSLVGIVGVVAFDAAELVFSFAGAIQAFAVFPGLTVSLVLNALIMRAHRDRGLSLAEKWMLAAEFALIGVLLVLHFWSHSGDALGAAILTWPVVIVLAVVIAIVAGVCNARRTTTSEPSAPPVPTP